MDIGVSRQDIAASAVFALVVGGLIILVPPGVSRGEPASGIAAADGIRMSGGFRQDAGQFVLDGGMTGQMYIDADHPAAVTMRAKSVNGSGTLTIYTAGAKHIFNAEMTAFPRTVSTPILSRSANGLFFTLQCDTPSACWARISNISVTPRPDIGVLPRRNWYAKLLHESYLWAGPNPTLYLNNDEESNFLYLTARSYNRSRNISVIVNGRLQKTVTVPVDSTGIIVEDLVPGRNNVTFRTGTDCTRIGAVIGNNDIRCVTLGIKDTQMASLDGITPGNNTVLGPGLLLSENATLYASGDGTYLLTMVAKTIGHQTPLTVFKDGKPITTVHVTPFGGPITLPLLNMTGTSRFTVQTGCPSNCDWINVTDLQFTRFEKAESDVQFRFGSHWYRKLQKEQHWWSYRNATIRVYNHHGSSVRTTLRVRGAAFHRSRDIIFTWNGQRVHRKTVSTTDNTYRLPVTLEPGENVLRITSPSRCTSIGQVVDNNDIRCVLFGLKSISLDDG